MPIRDINSIVYLGYARKSISLPQADLAGKTLVDLKTAVLPEAKGQIKEVSATALQRLLKQDVDRIGYVVQAAPEAKAYGLYSLLLLRRDFLNKKFTISIVCNNSFSGYFRSTLYNHAAAFYQSLYNENTYRSFAFRYNYIFGKMNSDVQKSKRGINNDDTAGGSKSDRIQ